MTGDPIRASAVALAAAIRRGEISARDVVAAHVERLRAAQRSTNAVVEDRYAAALTDAVAADAASRADGGGSSTAASKPLLGVPFTVKESIALRGMPNAAGLVSRRDHRAERTAPVVQRLIDAGAIPIAVTNTPELCLWVECSNRLHGRTSNAYDPRRTSGGSSGGEGAAVGSGGSPFGIGSDIGGSVRLPAFFNGVFGHKPSADIVPDTGSFPPAHGEAARMFTHGPLTRRAEDLMPILRLIAGPDGEDQATRSVELRDPDGVDFTGMPVTLIEQGGPLPVQKELKAALRRAGEALSDAGAQVRTSRVPSLRRAYELYLGALGTGNATPFLDIVGDGRPLTRGEVLRTALRRDRPHTVPLLVLVAMDAVPGMKSERQGRRIRAAALRLREAVLEEIGGGLLLYPPHPRVAPRHHRMLATPGALIYTAVFNLLELPVTQVPTGFASRSGLPLGVQVVGPPDADHVTIAAALHLERTLGGWVPPEEAPCRREPARA